ncbi:hypothetical protein HON22_05645 [Candidatus Peregrinibacteria bacterium]|jgi:hypothetical protein|nr:hypothetical protein [Candidatus Peregrinibacteria bacterium]
MKKNPGRVVQKVNEQVQKGRFLAAEKTAKTIELNSDWFAIASTIINEARKAAENSAIEIK